AVVALAEALNQKLPGPAEREPDEGGRDESALLLGQVEGLARKGEWAKAEGKAATAKSPQVRARAFTALAGAAADARAGRAADYVEARAVAHRVAVMERARHNVRADGGWAKNVDGWDESDHAFGSLGVAMGMQKEK